MAAQTEEAEILSLAPPLAISEAELIVIDDIIVKAAKSGKERGLFSDVMRFSSIIQDEALCRKADEVISECLTSIKSVVKEDTAEKLYERMAAVIDSWPDREEQDSLAIMFFRFMDTMTAMMAYKGKYRGVARKSSMTKSEALAILKERGLTKR